MIEPTKLHATLRPVQTLSASLLAGVPIPGPPGPEGPEGPAGPEGPPGQSANIVEYLFSSTTSAPPGAGQVRFNNANQTLATAMYLDDDQATGEEIGNLLLALPEAGAKLYVQDKDDDSRWQRYTLTGDPVDGGTYVQFPVSWIEGGSPLTEQRVKVAIMVTGPAGPTGPPGPINTIQDEGVPLTVRGTLNFAGPGVTVTDDAANGRTVVTVPGQSPWTADVDAAGFKLSNTGNVGIGVASGSYRLSVAGGRSFFQSNSSFFSVGLQNGPGLNPFWLGADTNADLVMSDPSGVERMRVMATGNVGIGVSSPSYRLDVQRDGNPLSDGSGAQVSIGGSTAPARRLLIGYDTGANKGYIQAIEQGSDVRTLAINPGGGNVGIGTSSPGYRLDVAGDINISAGSEYRKNGAVWNPQTPWTADVNAAGFKLNQVGYVNIQTGAGVAPKLNLFQGGAGSWDIQVPASVNALTFSVGGTELARIGSTGNVGIGNAGVEVFSAAGFLHTIIGSTTGSATGVLSVAFNDASGGGSVLTFANFARSGSDKRIGQISGNWDGSSDSGRMSFLTWSLGAGSEVMRLTSSKHAFISGPTAGPTTSVLPNNMLAIWMDEAAGKFTITGKTSAGVVKTATLTWA